MCRVAAFPRMFSKDRAIEIIKKMGQFQPDGAGVMYASEGKVHIVKAACSIEEALAAKVPLFDHMPHDGWSVFHLRQGSCGEKTYENAHPFLFKHGAAEWGVVHNGTWTTRYSLVKHAAPAGYIAGETDSEPAGWLLGNIGVKRFHKLYNTGNGIFMMLDKADVLSVSKNGWNLHYAEDKDGYTIFTTDDKVTLEPQYPFDNGYIVFNHDGEIIDWEEDKDEYRYDSHSNYGNHRYSGSQQSIQFNGAPQTTTYRPSEAMTKEVAGVVKGSSGRMVKQTYENGIWRVECKDGLSTYSLECQEPLFYARGNRIRFCDLDAARIMHKDGFSNAVAYAAAQSVLVSRERKAKEPDEVVVAKSDHDKYLEENIDRWIRDAGVDNMDTNPLSTQQSLWANGE